jgi:hypothetical protein
MTEIVLLSVPSAGRHTGPFERTFGPRLAIESQWHPDAVAAHSPELVITFGERDADLALCTAEMARRGVATLQVMDGILEWRNSWEYPTSIQMRPLNQPAVSHKIACLGRGDARLLESWGNVGRCEIVGAPRLDPLVRARRDAPPRPAAGQRMKLLVMTARTPGFTPEQVETTRRSLADLRDALEKRTDVEPVWRLTRDMHRTLGVRNSLRDLEGADLHDVLEQVDAVLTTPSTALLEAMLCGRPAALLDYHNTPHYVPAAWRVTCREQIEPTLEQLRHPPPARMLYQDYCLHDALSCRSEAMPRMERLIEGMLKARRESLARGETQPRFPHRILDDPEEHVAWPSAGFDLESLYPRHPVFGRTDVTAMQAELEAALGTVERLSNKVSILIRRLHMIPGYKFAGRLRKRFAKG